MENFLQSLKKAELHLHLEGSVEPETVLELDPTLSPEDVRGKYEFSDFAGFIRSYVWVNRLLRTPAHYGLIARRLLERLAAQNVTYAEINLSVGVILWKEQDFFGIYRAISEEASRSPVEVRWIFDAVRQFGAEPAQRVADLAIELRDDGVVGFGIGGDEKAGPAGWFRPLFAEVKEYGLALVPHAGETDGADSIWACVEMGADRIGHGIRAADDPELMAHLRDRRIPLEVCITSNVRTGAVPSLEAHPVRVLYEAGVLITLNSDDPAIFGCSLTSEFQLASDKFGFSSEELQGIAENAFRFSRATAAKRAVPPGSR